VTRIVCAGHVNWDVTLRVDRLPEADGEARITGQRQAGGGSASNVAAVLAGLEVAPTLIGSVGHDDHGHLVRREMDALGVETSLVEVADTETTVKYLVVDQQGEVMVLGNEGANESFTVDDVDTEAIRDADHLHLTNQRPDTALELAETAVEAGVSVSFDPGRRIADRAYDAVVELSDLIFLNEREAAHLADEALLDSIQTVVVKHGADGAEVREDGEVVSHPGYPIEPVDTTGAGDAFAAGFLATRDQRTTEAALAVANACGALAARTLGARLYLSWADVEAMLSIDAE